MNLLLPFLLASSFSFSFAAPPASVTCTLPNLPEGSTERYMIYRGPDSAALLVHKRNGRNEGTEAVLAKDLQCVHAKSDFRVLNCLHPAPEGSKWVSDARLTLLKHSYLSAGPVKERGEEAVDALTESYRLYFRDDRDDDEKEVTKTFRLVQCRESSAAERDWALGLVGR